MILHRNSYRAFAALGSRWGKYHLFCCDHRGRLVYWHFYDWTEDAAMNCGRDFALLVKEPTVFERWGNNDLGEDHWFDDVRAYFEHDLEPDMIASAPGPDNERFQIISPDDVGWRGWSQPDFDFVMAFYSELYSAGYWQQNDDDVCRRSFCERLPAFLDGIDL